MIAVISSHTVIFSTLTLFKLLSLHGGADSVSHRDISIMLVPDNKDNTMPVMRIIQVEGHVAVTV